MNSFTSWDRSLCHHGIKGQKWGIRRYQNEDGNLTSVGRKRYYSEDGSLNSKGERALGKELKKLSKLNKKLDMKSIRQQHKKVNDFGRNMRDISYTSGILGLMGVSGVVGTAVKAGSMGLYAGSRVAARILEHKMSDEVVKKNAMKAKQQADKIMSLFGKETLSGIKR